MAEGDELLNKTNINTNLKRILTEDEFDNYKLLLQYLDQNKSQILGKKKNKPINSIFYLKRQDNLIYKFLFLYLKKQLYF